MRRTVLLMASAWIVGFSCAGASAWAYARYNVWRDLGEKFQLGYVVGYLDGVLLAKRNDHRVALLALGGRQDYARWQARVNEFYADPANVGRPLPDAMQFAGLAFRDEAIDANRKRRERALASSPSPSATPSATAVPTADD